MKGRILGGDVSSIGEFEAIYHLLGHVRGELREVVKPSDKKAIYGGGDKMLAKDLKLEKDDKDKVIHDDGGDNDLDAGETDGARERAPADLRQKAAEFTAEARAKLGEVKGRILGGDVSSIDAIYEFEDGEFEAIYDLLAHVRFELREVMHSNNCQNLPLITATATNLNGTVVADIQLRSVFCESEIGGGTSIVKPRTVDHVRRRLLGHLHDEAAKLQMERKSVLDASFAENAEVCPKLRDFALQEGVEGKKTNEMKSREGRLYLVRVFVYS